jgi:hypothetical protein
MVCLATVRRDTPHGTFIRYARAEVGAQCAPGLATRTPNTCAHMRVCSSTAVRCYARKPPDLRAVLTRSSTNLAGNIQLFTNVAAVGERTRAATDPLSRMHTPRRTTGGFPPEWITSDSSMQSPRTAIPAMIEVSFPARFTPPT